MLFCVIFLSLFKPVELMNGTKREHSLICKGPVEVLVLDKEVSSKVIIQILLVIISLIPQYCGEKLHVNQYRNVVT